MNPRAVMHTPERRAARARAQLSRRQFLGGVGGVGLGVASVVTFGPGVSYAEHQNNPLQVPADRFGRMFPDLPPFIPADDRRRAALADMGAPGGMMDANDDLGAGPIDLIIDPELSRNNPDNPTHTAGVTFFGQFLDHDLTFDTGSPLGIPTPPEDVVNGRTPALDLDSVYGGGPGSDPELYEPDGLRLRVESGGLFEDVPRTGNTAVIADLRNDENAIISGLHAAFLLFHNAVVQRLQDEGFGGDLFQEARRIVTWHYQWLIVHEFLPLFIGQPLVQEILNNGRNFYHPEPGPAHIPVEFQIGYRFGHTMIRPSYRLNLAGDNGEAFFAMIFDPVGEGQADPVDLRGGARAPRRFVGWQTFFDFGDGEVRPNKLIDPILSTPLFQLPLQTIPDGAPPDSLATRNLLRHLTFGVPAGQRIAQVMGNPVLHLQQLAHYGVALENQSPLWFYMLAEAEQLANGVTLGPTGGRIVGEVFIGLLELDPSSYLAVDSGWQPTLPSQVPGDFRMTDLLRFAGVDPASRGQ